MQAVLGVFNQERVENLGVCGRKLEDGGEELNFKCQPVEIEWGNACFGT